MKTLGHFRAKPAVAASPTAASAPPTSGDPISIPETLQAVVYDWDLVDDRLTWGRNVTTALAGFPRESLATGVGFAGLVRGDSTTSRFHEIHSGQAVDEGQGVSYRATYRLVSHDGVGLDVEDFGRWFADETGRPRRAHGLLRVLPGGAQAVDAIAIATDGNPAPFCARRSFNTWVDARCAEARPGGACFAILILGIVNLAAIHRREGYDAADDLILAVGRKLAQSLRTGDRLVRYSGGRFALFVSLGSHDRLEEAAARIARSICAGAFETSAGALNAELRIGAALAPAHGRSAHQLLQCAEQAYDEAEGAQSAFAVHSLDHAIHRARRRDSDIGREIAAALEERRIALAFQTVASTQADGVGFEEALLRIVRRDGRPLGPQLLLPVARKLGLLDKLDERVLELVVERLADDRSRRLSVNVSAAALRSPRWLERLQGRLADCPGAGERLIIEILETEAVEDAAVAARAIDKIKRLGVRVAMDDFGAGRTSFRNLRQLGFDLVKIDGAFVQNLARSVDDRFFVRTLAALARHLKIETVAEWVEDTETVALLTEWGIDYLQGHAIGRAEVPPEIRAPRRAAAVRGRAMA